MLVAIARQLAITIAVLGMVGVSAIVWPLEDRPEAQLAAAGGRLCFAHDETVLIGAALEGAQIGDDIVVVASRVPSLQRLSLIESRVTDHGIKSLLSLHKLASLNLSRTSLTDGALNVISEFPALRELRLDGCEWLRDSHIVTLASMQNLEIVSLADTQVTMEGVGNLSRLPKLRYLLLENCQKITDQSVDALISLCRERHVNLSLSGTEITMPELIRLRQALPKSTIQFRPETMIGLRAIGDRGQFMTNELGEIRGFRRRTDFDGMIVPLQPGDLALISSVASLVEINLEQSNVDSAMLQELCELPNLQTLRLSNTLISDDGLVALARCPNLLNLSLMENDIEGHGLAHLRQTPQLENLRIQTVGGDEVLEHLDGLAHLQTLVVGAPLSDDAMERICNLPRLSSLTLIGTGVRSAGIAKLIGCETLRELRFESGRVDDSDIDAFASLPQLRWLIIPQTPITRTGRNRLFRLRPDLAVDWSGSINHRR